MDPELMSWVRICTTACLARDGTNCCVAKELVRACVFAINTEWFLRWNLEIGRTTENGNYRVNRIKNRVIEVLELADKKVLFQFIILKLDRYGSDLGLGMIGQDVMVSNYMHSMAVESEIIGYKSKRASCPFAGIDRYWDGIETDSSFQT